MTDKHIPASKLLALPKWNGYDLLDEVDQEAVKLSDLRALIDAEPESVEPVWIVSRDNKGRTTNIIPGHPTKFDIGKLPDGTLLFAAPPADNLIALAKEVLRISDRKHDAWDKLKALIAEIEGHNKYAGDE